ncbi:CubicO group peptidase (beta-lactamase class C family) [Chryseobacterium ginsenosidimutans]|uniref:serine hydrolase domain-containing protein n=1 Tax=Chryseobacterium ginsenosidimutans TaxID=687846 RepID=UPI002788350B|nr:serine hydrolase domain-containing protein [Chryseobacterium ginsenosidimutans]MDQ0593613.1 CubicO group peptidase (beta-lactamase class C family) [Chryseobacterium ginsenosidimutans]
MKKFKTKLLLTFFLSTIFCFQNLSAQTITDIKNDKNKSIDSLIKKKMNEAGIVGIGAAIIINKKLVWKHGYGYADKEKKIPFTHTTLMNIASISKTFTGFCIMKAVEERKVNLDEDINHYLPFKVINPNFPDEKITLRHLATHTSGLADRYPFYTDSTYFYNGQRPEALGNFLKNYFVKGGNHYSKDNFLNSKPGTNRDYSNIGAGLAGYIIELRTGKKLNEYSKQNIFNPLKMANSGWDLSEINIKNHSKLYQKKGDRIQPIPLYEGITYPDGGVRTSVNELSRFFITLLNDGKYNNTRLLKKELAEEMLRFQFTESNKPDNVKLDKLNSGIFWATKMGGKRIGHNGSDPGVRTFMLSDLKKEIAVIVFFNTSLNEADEDKFFDIYEDLHNYGSELRSKLPKN